MDSKKRPTEERRQINKHRGFYAALYSCVGVMLVLAAFIGYANFIRPDTEPEYDLAEHGISGMADNFADGAGDIHGAIGPIPADIYDFAHDARSRGRP